MISFVRRLPDLAARHRIKVILCVVLITLVAVAALPGLRLQGGIYELFPRRPGPISDLATVGKVFTGQREVVVLVTGDRVENVARAVRVLASELSGSPLIRTVQAGIERKDLVSSIKRSMLLLAGPAAWEETEKRLTRELEHRVTRLRRLLLSPLTPDRAALQNDPLGLAEVLLSTLGRQRVDHRTGLFSNEKGTAALLFAGAERGPDDLAFCGQLHHELNAMGQRLARKMPTVRVQFTGPYFYAHYMSKMLRRDLTLSSLVALGGAVLMLMLFFRSIRLIPLAGLISGLAVLWTLALAAVFVGELNALSLSFAALCVGLGLDALIHITARMRQPGQLNTALRSLMPALLAASASTIAAFVTFSISSFAGLSQTGALAACGLALTLILTLTLPPALERLVPHVQKTPMVDRGLSWLGGGVQRRCWLVLAITVLLSILAVVSATGLRFSRDMTRLAPADIPPAIADQSIAKEFSRARHRWIVLLQGDSLQQVLQINDRLADRLEEWRRQRRIAGYSSLAGVLPARQTQRIRLKRLARLNPQQVVQNVKNALAAADLEPRAFDAFYPSLLDPRELSLEDLPPSMMPLVRRQLARTGSSVMVATVLHPLPRTDPADLGRSLRSLATNGVKIRLTGADLAGEQMARLLRGDLLVIGALCLAVVVVVLALLLRDPRPAAACLVSLVVSAMIFLGVLSLVGIDLDLYNLMVVPILVGYGVDDHIYVVRRAVVDGIVRAVTDSGRAVLTTTLTSMAAFGALGLCSLPGLRSLGLTAVLGLLICLAGSLVVLPALVAILCPGRRTGYTIAS